MAIRAELSADRERGAGYGLLRIEGLTGGLTAGTAAGDGGPLHFSLRRNQGTAPFLGEGGVWQATEAWHPLERYPLDGDALHLDPLHRDPLNPEPPAAAAASAGDCLIARLGPTIIDPLVREPTKNTYQLTLAIGASKQITSLRVIRPLFGKEAASDPFLAHRPPPEAEPQQTEEERRRLEEEAASRAEREAAERARREEEEAARQRLADAAAQVSASEAPPPRRRLGLLIACGLLAFAAVGAGGWYGCVIPGFAAPHCRLTPPSSAPSPPKEAAALSCTGLDAAACYQMGTSALQQRQLEPARQLFQQAAGLGSIEASLAVGRMYDPETWSADASPVAQPNWETATYWYEKAARQGNLLAQASAGRLLCGNGKSEFERGQGRAYLEQAAGAGNAEAKQLLAQCR